MPILSAYPANQGLKRRDTAADMPKDTNPLLNRKTSILSRYPADTKSGNTCINEQIKQRGKGGNVRPPIVELRRRQGCEKTRKNGTHFHVGSSMKDSVSDQSSNSGLDLRLELSKIGGAATNGDAIQPGSRGHSLLRLWPCPHSVIRC